jgi:hypothetical protein
MPGKSKYVCAFSSTPGAFLQGGRWSINCMVGDKKRHIQDFTSAQAKLKQKVGGCSMVVVGTLALRVRRVRFQLLQFIAIVLHGGGERTKRQGKAIKLCAVNLSHWPHAAPLTVLQTLLIPKPALMCTLSVPTWKISGHREYFSAYWTHTMVHDFLCKYFVLNSMTTK